MKYTFKDACEYLADTVKNGLTPTHEAVKKRVNNCQQDLMMRLESQYKRAFMNLYSHNGVITCPASVERIVKHSFSDFPRSVYSEAYQFLDYGPGSRDRLIGGRSGDLVDLGSSFATYYDPHTAMNLMAFSDSNLDTDVEIEIQGAAVDGFLPDLHQFENEGHKQTSLKVIPRYNGLSEMVWDQSNASAQAFTRIDAVIKPRTQGSVILMGWVKNDDGSPFMYPLGKYGKTEKVPNYRRYQIAGNADGMTGIYALVQLTHSELVEDNDILLIQNLAALKAESLAIETMPMDSGRAIHFQNIAAKQVRDQLKNAYVMSTEITFDVDSPIGPRGL